MMCYMDRMFCSERGCATECYRRYYGAEHEERAQRLGAMVSLCGLRGGEYCQGYTASQKAVDDDKTVSV
jgi:hypothetical protein